MTRVWSVNIVFVEPSFPRNQRRFVQALAERRCQRHRRR